MKTIITNLKSKSTNECAFGRFIKISMVICLLIISTFCSCTKSAQSPQSVIMFDANQLAYIQLGLGKYFIYKDSVKNETDSIVVTQSSIKTNNNYGEGESYSNQQFNLTLAKIENNVSTIWLSGTANAGGGNIDLVSTNTYGDLYKSYGTFIPDMVVEGINYINVILTINDNGLSPSAAGYYHSEYYWTAGTGLIKSTVINNTSTITYTLLRNN
jgi:hypothetical protein